jgi:hypothetical protein
MFGAREVNSNAYLAARANELQIARLTLNSATLNTQLVFPPKRYSKTAAGK